jgi:hypothetical protein
MDEMSQASFGYEDSNHPTDPHVAPPMPPAGDQPDAAVLVAPVAGANQSPRVLSDDSSWVNHRGMHSKTRIDRFSRVFGSRHVANAADVANNIVAMPDAEVNIAQIRNHDAIALFVPAASSFGSLAERPPSGIAMDTKMMLFSVLHAGLQMVLGSNVCLYVMTIHTTEGTGQTEVEMEQLDIVGYILVCVHRETLDMYRRGITGSVVRVPSSAAQVGTMAFTTAVQSVGRAPVLISKRVRPMFVDGGNVHDELNQVSFTREASAILTEFWRLVPTLVGTQAPTDRDELSACNLVHRLPSNMVGRLGPVTWTQARARDICCNTTNAHPLASDVLATLCLRRAVEAAGVAVFERRVARRRTTDPDGASQMRADNATKGAWLAQFDTDLMDTPILRGRATGPYFNGYLYTTPMGVWDILRLQLPTESFATGADIRLLYSEYARRTDSEAHAIAAVESRTVSLLSSVAPDADPWELTPEALLYCASDGADQFDVAALAPLTEAASARRALRHHAARAPLVLPSERSQHALFDDDTIMALQGSPEPLFEDDSDSEGEPEATAEAGAECRMLPPLPASVVTVRPGCLVPGMSRSSNYYSTMCAFVTRLTAPDTPIVMPSDPMLVVAVLARAIFSASTDTANRNVPLQLPHYIRLLTTPRAWAASVPFRRELSVRHHTRRVMQSHGVPINMLYAGERGLDCLGAALMSASPPHLCIIGYSGCGKTPVFTALRAILSGAGAFAIDRTGNDTAIRMADDGRGVHIYMEVIAAIARTRSGDVHNTDDIRRLLNELCDRTVINRGRMDGNNANLPAEAPRSHCATFFIASNSVLESSVAGRFATFTCGKIANDLDMRRDRTWNTDEIQSITLVVALATMYLVLYESGVPGITLDDQLLPTDSDLYSQLAEEVAASIGRSSYVARAITRAQSYALGAALIDAADQVICDLAHDEARLDMLSRHLGDVTTGHAALGLLCHAMAPYVKITVAHAIHGLYAMGELLFELTFYTRLGQLLDVPDLVDGPSVPMAPVSDDPGASFMNLLTTQAMDLHNTERGPTEARTPCIAREGQTGFRVRGLFSAHEGTAGHRVTEASGETYNGSTIMFMPGNMADSVRPTGALAKTLGVSRPLSTERAKAKLITGSLLPMADDAGRMLAHMGMYTQSIDRLAIRVIPRGPARAVVGALLSTPVAVGAGLVVDTMDEIPGACIHTNPSTDRAWGAVEFGVLLAMRDLHPLAVSCEATVDVRTLGRQARPEPMASSVVRDRLIGLVAAVAAPDDPNVLRVDVARAIAAMDDPATAAMLHGLRGEFVALDLTRVYERALLARALATCAESAFVIPVGGALVRIGAWPARYRDLVPEIETELHEAWTNSIGGSVRLDAVIDRALDRGAPSNITDAISGYLANVATVFSDLWPVGANVDVLGIRSIMAESCLKHPRHLRRTPASAAAHAAASLTHYVYTSSSNTNSAIGSSVLPVDLFGTPVIQSCGTTPSTADRDVMLRVINGTPAHDRTETAMVSVPFNILTTLHSLMLNPITRVALQSPLVLSPTMVLVTDNTESPFIPRTPFEVPYRPPASYRADTARASTRTILTCPLDAISDYVTRGTVVERAEILRREVARRHLVPADEALLL